MKIEFINQNGTYTLLLKSSTRAYIRIQMSFQSVHRTNNLIKLIEIFFNSIIRYLRMYLIQKKF